MLMFPEHRNTEFISRAGEAAQPGKNIVGYVSRCGLITSNRNFGALPAWAEVGRAGMTSWRSSSRAGGNKGGSFPGFSFCGFNAPQRVKRDLFQGSRNVQLEFNLTPSTKYDPHQNYFSLCHFSCPGPAILRPPINYPGNQYQMATDWTELNGDDDDDAALGRAIALSLSQDLPEADDDNMAPSQITRNPPVTADRAAPSSMSAMGLDRKKMEAERLARSRKRKAEDDNTSDVTRVNRPANNHSQAPPSQWPKLQTPSLAQQPMLSTGHGLNSKPHSARAPAGAAGMPKAPVSGPLPYPKGIVLRTFARGRPRDNDITIEEVLQKDDLELAVLSSFQWDEDLLMEKLDLRRTKVLLIAFAKDNAHVCIYLCSVETTLCGVSSRALNIGNTLP